MAIDASARNCTASKTSALNAWNYAVLSSGNPLRNPDNIGNRENQAFFAAKLSGPDKSPQVAWVSYGGCRPRPDCFFWTALCARNKCSGALHSSRGSLRRMVCVMACVTTRRSLPVSSRLRWCRSVTRKRQRTRIYPAWTLPFCVASCRLLSARIHSPYEMAWKRSPVRSRSGPPNSPQ